MNEVFERYLRDFKNVGKRERIIIISILITAFAIGIVGSYAYKNLSRQPFDSAQGKPTTIPTPLPKVALLSLMSKTQEATVGDKLDVTLNLNSGDLGVEAADFVVNFDPEYLKVASVSTGTFFKNYPIKSTGDNFVKISGVADFTEKSVVVPKGEGTVATITFESLQATESTKVSLDKVKTIVASGGQNILNATQLRDFTVSITK